MKRKRTRTRLLQLSARARLLGWTDVLIKEDGNGQYYVRGRPPGKRFLKRFTSKRDRKRKTHA